ncbi:Multistep phosphorelay regulator 1 [Beauveria bassiana]|nr:Multistep phosphorelay regulator 1 [Beauveria bassiana]
MLSLAPQRSAVSPSSSSYPPTYTCPEDCVCTNMPTASDAEDDYTDDEMEIDLGDAVDMPTFSQILEMDEPGDREFSSSIVFGFFDQVEETFASMDKAVEEKNLEELSSLGHFLKGSSATLGLVRVRDGCEKIQRFGKLENEDGSSEPDAELCLERIREALATVKTDYQAAEIRLREFYKAEGGEDA